MASRWVTIVPHALRSRCVRVTWSSPHIRTGSVRVLAAPWAESSICGFEGFAGFGWVVWAAGPVDVLARGGADRLQTRVGCITDPGGDNQSRLPMLGAAAGGGSGPRRARKSMPESSKPESHSRVVGVVPKPPRSFRSPFAGSDSAGSGGGALHPAPPGGSRAAGPQASSRYYAMLGGGGNSGSNSAGSLHSGHGGSSYDTPGADRRSRAHSSMSSPAARRDGDGSPGQRHRIVITPVT